MDGADGLAGGMAVFGFGAYAVAAGATGAYALALLDAVIAAAALAFLYFNFPPARIFMGDVGSVVLGFLAGALGLAGAWQRVWPAWFPLLVFSPFIVDASATLLRRALSGERVWAAHRSHYYQRMVRMGLGHLGMLRLWYLLMCGVAVSALLLVDAGFEVQALAITMWGFAYVFLAVRIDRAWRRSKAADN
jgi:UDP-N-acetylmuramyl pentapeptide phosphotransferase/UDP-N-acetylglucosamine-1-phosphate transferase